MPGCTRPECAAYPGLSGRDIRVAASSLLVFLAHDLEEAWRVEETNRVLADVAGRLPKRLSRRLTALETSRPQMLLAAAQLLLLEAATLAWAWRCRLGESLFAAMVAARMLNGAQHVAQSLLLRRYVPGWRRHR